MKKRMIAVLVAILLLCLPLAVHAEEVNEPLYSTIVTAPITTTGPDGSISRNPDVHAPGDTVTVSVTLPSAMEAVSSGALEVAYDTDHLELTEVKWVLTGLLIKHFDTATARGVFSFSNPKHLEGEIATLTFKIKDTALSADYAIETTVQLMANGIKTANVIGSVITVGQPEVPEIPVSTADFTAAVSALSDPAASETDYDAICKALDLYENLSDSQKSDVSGSYQLLKVKVEGYNACADVANEEAEKSTETAFSAMARAFSFLGELFEVFRTQIWVLR